MIEFMAQYIDKSALVAEIENLIDKDKHHDYYQIAFRDGNNSALYALKGRIDTLEVKEVDLEKEYEDFVVDDPILGNFITNDTMGMKLAKHFFELGLKAQKEE